MKPMTLIRLLISFKIVIKIMIQPLETKLGFHRYVESDGIDSIIAEPIPID